MKNNYKRPDDLREVLPVEYFVRALVLNYDPTALDEIFEASVKQAEFVNKPEKYLDYYRMNLIADIDESMQLIEEEKEDEE